MQKEIRHDVSDKGRQSPMCLMFSDVRSDRVCARSRTRVCLSICACAFPHRSPKTFQHLDAEQNALCIVLVNTAPCWPTEGQGLWRETQLSHHEVTLAVCPSPDIYAVCKQVMSMWGGKMLCLSRNLLPSGDILGIFFSE